MTKTINRMLATGALALSLVACAGQAATTKEQGEDKAAAKTEARHDPVAHLSQNAKRAEAIATYDDAFRAMREVRAARLAIFDGEAPIAVELVDNARTNLAAARAEFEKLEASERRPRIEPGYLPFDLSIALAEDYREQPAKASAVAKANEHIKKGERDKAIETLRLADIRVETSAAVLPVKSTMEHLDKAHAMLREGKFYEANLQLKAVEDSVVISFYDSEYKPLPKSAATPSR
jgi:tetratricopeptide (TPR) repeat protein